MISPVNVMANGRPPKKTAVFPISPCAPEDEPSLCVGKPAAVARVFELRSKTLCGSGEIGCDGDGTLLRREKIRGGRCDDKRSQEGYFHHSPRMVPHTGHSGRRTRGILSNLMRRVSK